MSQGFGQSALDVGQNAQVLLGPSPQLGAGSAQLEGAVELLPCLLDGAGLEVEPRQSIEGFGGQHRIAHGQARLVAFLAKRPGRLGFIPVVVNHSQPAQCLSQHPTLAGAFSRLDRGGITLHRLAHGAGAFVGPTQLQQLGRRGRLRRCLQLGGDTIAGALHQ